MRSELCDMFILENGVDVDSAAQLEKISNVGGEAASHLPLLIAPRALHTYLSIGWNNKSLIHTLNVADLFITSPCH